jgi:DNA-binding Lrp family transcriptional regulator
LGKIRKFFPKKHLKVYKYEISFQKMKLDEKYLSILSILKEDSSLTTSKISKKTSIPITTVHNRIQKMKKSEVIKNYTLNIDYEKIGKHVSAYVLITINNETSNSGKNKGRLEEVARNAKIINGVESVDMVTGSADIIVKIRTDSMKSMNDLLTYKLRGIEGVDKTQTMVVLKEV